MTPCTTVWQGVVLFVEAHHTTEEEQQATKKLLHLSATNLCDANFPLYMLIKIIRTVVFNKISIQGWGYSTKVGRKLT